MAPEKETTMVLKVDLDCYRCYTKVKRVLCSFPQIQDQIYNTKQNMVMIKVVCCSPEKIRDKIAIKGGKSIKGIEIIEKKPPPAAADKPGDKPPSKPADKPAAPAGGPPPGDKPNKPTQPPADDKPAKKNVTFKPEGDAPPSKPKGDAPPSKPKGDAPPAAKPAGDGAPSKPKDSGPPPAQQKPAEQAAAMAYMMPPAVYGYGYPVNVGCLDCYEGRMCYQHGAGNGFGYGGGYGVPPPPPPAGGYYGNGAGPSGYGQNYKPGYCVSRYGDYVSEENANGCVVM